MTDFVENAIVPLFAIFMVCGMPILAWIFFRVLAHRERILMIQHGIAPGPTGRPSPAMPSKAFREPEPAQLTLMKGIRLAFIGFAITLGLSFIGYRGDGVWQPGPWLLGGLIPLFIGIAQITIALISGATFGPNFTASRGQAPYGSAFGAPAEPPSPPSSASFDGPYTYRPGSTEQLRPPTSPPERR